MSRSRVWKFKRAQMRTGANRPPSSTRAQHSAETTDIFSSQFFCLPPLSARHNVSEDRVVCDTPFSPRNPLPPQIANDERYFQHVSIFFLQFDDVTLLDLLLFVESSFLSWLVKQFRRVANFRIYRDFCENSGNGVWDISRLFDHRSCYIWRTSCLVN